MARKVKKRLLTLDELSQKVLYFAYGSNMHQPRLEERVGPVKLIGVYSLKGYKLTFDTGTRYCSFANVEQVKGETCEGVIYEMTYGQLRMLDYYEGLYTRVKEDYKGRKLHIYISERHRDKRREPEITTEYYALLMLGCKEHNLQKSLAIVSQLKPRPAVLEYMAMYYEERWD